MTDFMQRKREEEGEKTKRIFRLANKFIEEETFARGRNRFEVICEAFRTMIDEGEI